MAMASDYARYEKRGGGDDEDEVSYYDILGVPKDATLKHITKRYRTLTLKLRPDNAEITDTDREAFNQVQQAYNTLRDPKLRKRYDIFGKEDIRQGNDDDIIKTGDIANTPAMIIQQVKKNTQNRRDWGKLFEEQMLLTDCRTELNYSAASRK